MKGNHLLLASLAGLALFSSLAFAQKKISDKPIYKWVKDGLIHYSYVKPTDIKDYETLDSRGRKITYYTKDFDQIIEITKKPQQLEITDEQDSKDIDDIGEKVQALQSQNTRKKNCKTARANMKKLDGGEVYEKDAKGNLIRLSKAQIANKRLDVERDIDYFCSP